MADITKKDSNDLWAEMPPSGKKRMIEQQEKAADAPKPEENGKSKKKSGKKAEKNNKKSKTDKKNKKSKAPSKEVSANKDEKPAKSNDNRIPQFLGDGETTEIPVAKPVDIQNRALKNKGRSTDEKKKKRHRNRLSAYTIHFVLFGIILVVILCVLSTTVLFNLSDFTINGETVYTNEEIIAATGVHPGENLILMDEGAVKDRLIEALPYVDKVEVSRNIITCKLEITLNQAKAVANVKKNDVYYLVSENGRIMNAGLKTPDKNCVVVYGFDPEYASSGDFLSAADEKHRNMLSKLLRAVKQYDDIDDGNEYEAQKKYDALFSLISVCEETGISEHIKSIDISNIYGITLSYDNKLTLELGDIKDAKLKLTVAKNLIDKGEFDGEKGLLILSQLSDNSYNMKVTFRPEYDETSKDETSGNESSKPSPPENESEPEIEPGYSTEPEE